MKLIKLDKLSPRILELIELEFEQQLTLWLAFIDPESDVTFQADFKDTQQIGLEIQALFSQLPDTVQIQSVDLQRGIKNLIMFAQQAEKLNTSLLSPNVSGDQIAELLEELEESYTVTKNCFEAYQKKKSFSNYPLFSQIKNTFSRK